MDDYEPTLLLWTGPAGTAPSARPSQTFGRQQPAL